MLEPTSATKACPHLDDSDVEISVVVPVFGCRDSLEDLCDRLYTVLKRLGQSSELILVLDGPRGVEQNLVEADATRLSRLWIGPQLRIVSLSRNVGQHAAIRCGIREARGTRVLVLDCDLQDDPDAIPNILETMDATGDEVVLTRRVGNFDEVPRRLSRWVFERALENLTGVKVPHDLGTPIGLSRLAVSYVNAFREDAHILHILLWLNLSTSVIPLSRRRRHKGRSSYSFRRKMVHAVRGLSFSLSRVITLATLISVAVIVVSLLGVIALMVLAIIGTPPSGWTSSLVVFGVGFGSLGLLASVIGFSQVEILNLVRQRPPFVIQNRDVSTLIAGESPTPVDALRPLRIEHTS